MKILLLVLLSAGLGMAHAETNVEKLRAHDWILIETGGQFDIEHSLSFKTPGVLQVKVSCRFNEKGLGPDLTAQVSASVEVTDTQIRYLETKNETTRDNNTGNYCTAYAAKGQTSYTFLSPDAVLMNGVIYTAPDESTVPTPAIVGNKWTFTFANNGIDLEIVQDFTVEGILTTTATCKFPQPITVSVSAPVEVTDTQIVNSRSETNRITDANGNWCSAIIPKRNITFKMLSDDQVQIDNDPLHPEGILWNKVK